MEKSTPKERKTRAKAAAPVQPENSDTPAENAAEQQPAADTPSVEQPAPVPSENASDSVKKSDTAASPRSRGKNYSESRRKAQSGEPEQDTFFENAQPDLLVVPAEPVGAVLAYLVLMPFMTPTLMGCILAGVAGIMVFISIDELLPAAREYGEAHISIYGVVAGMALMAVSLIILG